MKGLLIFDTSRIFYRSLPGECACADIFPLTADPDDVNSVAAGLKKRGVEVNILNSAEHINNEASKYKDKFIEWAASISNLRVKSKPIRQRMLVSDGGVSAWWFGLLADKDPSKSPVFLKICQAGAILRAVTDNSSDIVLLAIKDRCFLKKLKFILKKHGVRCKSVKCKSYLVDIAETIKGVLKTKRIFCFLHAFGKALAGIMYVKKAMPKMHTRKTSFNDALLFFTYFPSLIEEDAQKGVFRNRFALPLQDACGRNKKTIAWVLTYADFDNYSFKDAVALGKKFAEHNENVFFPSEFLVAKSLLNTLIEYWRLAVIWRRIRSEITVDAVNSDIKNDFAGIFLLEALDDSFYGDYLLNALIQYEAFKNMFKALDGFSHGLYMCEMMGWEYALVAAKKVSKKDFPIVGYQDFAFSTHYLQLYHSREELKYKNTLDGIPLPEILATCGSIPQRMLTEYYDRVENLETLRHIYINEVLRQEKGAAKAGSNEKFILLVSTSIELNESKAIVNLIKASYPIAGDGLEIWFKGHPALPIEKIFEKTDIDAAKSNYMIKKGRISDFLSQCDAVLVGTSTVAVEALAFGCNVLVYLNPETLNQSPLIGFEEHYLKIYNPSDLRAAINRMQLRTMPNLGGIERKQKFVRDYWNLNDSLDGWKRVLNLNEEREDAEIKQKAGFE